MKEIFKELMQHPVVVGIKNEIVQNYFADFGWTHGGCFALAEAIVAVLPGSELWVVGSQQEQDWAAEHAVVKYRGRFYDGNGEKTRKQLLAGYKERVVKLDNMQTWVEKPGKDSLWYPQQEFVKNEEIKRIGEIFHLVSRTGD